MPRVDYTYTLENHDGNRVIAIVDQNLGGTSVTNAIEHVVDEIAELESLDPMKCVIVYRDSDGQWDGWDHKSRNYIPLIGTNWQDAVSTMLDS